MLMELAIYPNLDMNALKEYLVKHPRKENSAMYTVYMLWDGIYHELIDVKTEAEALNLIKGFYLFDKMMDEKHIEDFRDNIYGYTTKDFPMNADGIIGFEQVK